MDARPLYNESFSYSWVLHLKPSSFDASGDLHSRKFSIDSLDDGPFIEIDLLKMTPLLTTTPSTTTTTVTATTTTATAVSGNHHCHHGSNDFIFPTSQPLTLVPADRLFLDGHLLPLHLTHLEPELLDSPPESTDSSDAPCRPRDCRTFFQRCRTSFHHIFRKLSRRQKRSGRKNQSSVADVSTADEMARKQCAEVGHGAGALSSAHRCSVDDEMLRPRRSFGVVDNLGSCFSCPTTPGHESHM